MRAHNGKIGVVFLMALFIFATINLGVAETINENDVEIVVEVTPVDNPSSEVGMYGNPVVVITEPEDGDTIYIPYLEVLGYASDQAGLDFIQWKWEWSGGYYINSSDLDVSKYYNFRIRVYNLRPGWHRMTVMFCNIEDNCSTDSVEVTYLENQSPTKPGRPEGPDRGVVDEEYTFTTHSTDPEDDTIRYGWDWNGDNVVDEWTDYYPSGETIETTHSWSISGTYPIKVMAEDDNGGESDLSSPLAIVISDNDPPAKPSTPSGSTSGFPGRSYSYSSSTTDANDDRIYYMFDWDDGTELEWNGPYSSGDTVSVSIYGRLEVHIV